MKRIISFFLCAFIIASFFTAKPVAAAEIICGDVNQNGKTELSDLTFLAKKLAGWTNLGSFSFVAADVYCDGRLTLEDVTLFAKLLAGWQVAVPTYLNAAPKIWIIGDSTADMYYYWIDGVKYLQMQSDGRDLMGWGCYLNNYFDSPVTVRDEAWSGRSARSYYADAAKYNDVMNACKPGDYCIIQFGHNDEIVNTDRYSSAAVSWHEVDELCVTEDGTYSFQGVLYYWYILPLLEKGVTPILASPITRLGVADCGSDIALHIPYANAAQSLAQELGLVYLPMMEITSNYWDEVYDAYGAEATATLHAFATEARTNTDRTHLSHYGAYIVAGLYADELCKSVPRLNQNRRTIPLAFDGIVPEWALS